MEHLKENAIFFLTIIIIIILIIIIKNFFIKYFNQMTIIIMKLLFIIRSSKDSLIKFKKVEIDVINTIFQFSEELYNQ